MSEELPLVFRHHIFCCAQQRPPGHPRGSCGAQGAQPLWERLGQRLQQLQRGDIALTSTGCLGFCNAGPLMVIYPLGVWYAPKTVEDIDEVVQSHLIDGHIVERLALVLQP